jgi:threonine/homoserine efflux transporter RhtA
MGSHTLWVVIAVIGIILLIVGGVSSALNFLLWVGIVLLVIAVILFILRMVRGGTRGRI